MLGYFRGSQRSGDDGEIALVVHDLGGVVHEGLANALGSGLVHEKITRVRVGVGVEGNDFDPMSAGFFQDGRQAAAVFHGGGDGIDPAARDPGFDSFILLSRVGIGRPIPD
jgi:hypothetical protein